MKKILKTLEKQVWLKILRHIKVVLVFFMLLTIYLSTIPGEVEEATLENTVYLWVNPNIQSIAHVIFYAILATLWCLYLNTKKLKYLSVILASFIITATFGIANETAQYYIPGRDAIMSDAILNAIGAGLGIWYFDKRIKHKTYVN